MKKKPKTRITVNLDNELYNVVKAISQASDKTMGEVMEMAIQKIYDKYDEDTKRIIQSNDDRKQKLMAPFKEEVFEFVDNNGGNKKLKTKKNQSKNPDQAMMTVTFGGQDND